MWIFTNQGFISAVRHTENPQLLMVRARAKSHLAEFVGPAYDADIYRVSGSDYQYRIEVNEDVFKALLSVQVDQLDYPNFKNSIMSHDRVRYQHTCSAVWHVLADHYGCYESF